jgi:hypothetical protein
VTGAGHKLAAIPLMTMTMTMKSPATASTSSVSYGGAGSSGFTVPQDVRTLAPHIGLGMFGFMNLTIARSTLTSPSFTAGALEAAYPIIMRTVFKPRGRATRTAGTEARVGPINGTASSRPARNPSARTFGRPISA